MALETVLCFLPFHPLSLGFWGNFGGKSSFSWVIRKPWEASSLVFGSDEGRIVDCLELFDISRLEDIRRKIENIVGNCLPVRA